MKLNIVEIAKEVFNDKKLLVEELPNGEAKIWYKGKIKSPNPVNLPKTIYLDEGFIEAIGLYCGDGKLTLKEMILNQ